MVGGRGWEGREEQKDQRVVTFFLRLASIVVNVLYSGKNFTGFNFGRYMGACGPTCAHTNVHISQV